MKLAATILFAIVCALAARAELATDLAHAFRPSMEGVPEIAVARLRALLKTDLVESKWRDVAEKLVEALVAADAFEDALQLLEDPRLRHDGSPMFWRAQALANLKRWSEALPLYLSLTENESSPFRAESIFGGAEMLRALGRDEDAVQQLARLYGDVQFGTRARLRSVELLLNRGAIGPARDLLGQVQPKGVGARKERRFLRGRLQMLSGQLNEAADDFESVLKTREGGSHSVSIAALFALADVHLQLKTPETGDEFLEAYMEKHPNDEALARIFEKLDELYRAQRRPARGDLLRWTRDSTQPRRAFAQWYLARMDLRAGRTDRAARGFSELQRTDAKDPALAAGFLEYARFLKEEYRSDEITDILNSARALHPDAALRARIDMFAAECDYRAKRYKEAAQTFHQIGQSHSEFAGACFFNASLAWLQIGAKARSIDALQKLSAGSGSDEERATIKLEEALLLASKGDERAGDALRNFTRDFPKHDRAAEAWVTLAELAFHAKPPRLEEARKYLAQAGEATPNQVATERADYLRIWIEAADNTDEKTIEAAKQFLQKYEQSPLAKDARMKLAEAFYRRQDYPNAQTQFEILARQNPGGVLAEKAEFFAAESAIASMAPNSLERAADSLERVVNHGGDLKWAARNQQAVIERKLGKPQNALLLYEEVLKSDARAAEKWEALCAKGDIYFELASSDAANYRRAWAAYDQLAKDDSAPAHWRNQAAFKKGLCLEKQADRPGALTVFYEVIEPQGEGGGQPEQFWFYKAGFNAARLLEEEGKWESAAAVYEKLAAIGGARSDEARSRMNQLRLEHFLWEH